MPELQDDETTEPAPTGRPVLAPPFSDPIPFGAPPEEQVTVIGEVPWELRDAD